MPVSVPTFAAAPTRPPLSLRIRNAVAGTGLTLLGVRGTPRSARWLATRAAHGAALAPPHAPELIATGRDRLAAANDGRLARHRAAHAAAPDRARLRALLPTLAQTAQDAADRVTRLEAQIPSGATEEPAGLLLRVLLGAALLTEGLTFYMSLGGTPLADSPIVLLASALTATALAAALLHRAGVLCRRSVWSRRIIASDAVAIGLGIAVPVALGVGLVLSRVDATAGVSPTGRVTAFALQGALQAVLLTPALLSGYLYAVPVGGLSAARRRRAAAIRAHDRVAADLQRLEADAAAGEVALLTRQAEAHREYKLTVAQLLPMQLRAQGGGAIDPGHLQLRFAPERVA